MKLIRDLDEFPSELQRGAVAIGNFDGVHVGHARIVEALCAMARQVDGPAVVFTFDPHPVRILRPEQTPPPLTWIERKAQLLKRLGVDAVIAYPTDVALLELTPQQFFDEIVRDSLDAQALVEGSNFYFGRDRAGNIELLTRLVDQSDMRLEVVSAVRLDGDTVSSSRIRKDIATGNVRRAAAMLTQPYRIRGMVTHGAGRGAKIGFPTANVDAVDTLIPGFGVYAGRAEIAGQPWPAAIHVGPNPTFGRQAATLEVHLIGFGGSIYGEVLEVDFIDRLRDIQTFDSANQLSAQLARDIESTQNRLSGTNFAGFETGSSQPGGSQPGGSTHQSGSGIETGSNNPSPP